MRGRKEHGDDLLHDPLHGSLIGSRGCFDDPSDSITLGPVSEGLTDSFFSDKPESLFGLLACRAAAARLQR